MIEDQDIRRLSEVHSERPSYISLYLEGNEATGERFIKGRESEIMKALSGDKELKQDFKDGMTMVWDWFDPKRLADAKGFAVFSSGPGDLFEVYPLHVRTDDLLVFDTSPYIKPLAEMHEEYEPLCIVLIDEGNARVLVTEMGETVETDTLHKDIMNKHRMGGCSQRRFQRLRAGSLVHFYKEVADSMEELVGREGVKRIVLAGPGTAKKELLKHLPRALQDKVIESLDISFSASESELVETALESFFKREREEEGELVARIRAGVMGQGLVAYGVKAVKDSVITGRADKIALVKGTARAGYKCESCGTIWEVDPGKGCNACGKGSVVKVDEIEEIVEAAEQMGTDVEFVEENEFLEQLGGIAAVLRY